MVIIFLKEKLKFENGLFQRVYLEIVFKNMFLLFFFKKKNLQRK